MKIIYRFLSFAILSALILAGCSKNDYVVAPGTTGGDYIVILKLNTGGIQSTVPAQEKIRSFIKGHGIAEDKVFYIYESVVTGFAATLTPEQVNALSQDKNVSFVEKDQVMKLVDPVVENYDYNYKGKKSVLTEYTPWGVRNVGGYIDCSSSTFTKLAWIVDTGINLTHPDLNVNTSLSKTFVRTGQDRYTAEDYNGHGSHVSGTIAAKYNGSGVVGIAAGARLVAVKVLDRNGSGNVSDIVAGLNYIYNYVTTNNRNGDVLNCSFGGSYSSTLDAAFAQFATYNTNNPATVTYISIAAGNSGANAANYSPADVNGTGIYTVSAYDSTGTFASWSNWGYPNPVDYSAPGVNILSTYKNGGYATLSGTSMATPHVAGILLAKGSITSSGTVTDSQGTSEPKAHE